MKWFFLAVSLIMSFGEEVPGKTFLRFVYGDAVGDVGRVCMATNDLWMLAGKRDEAALKAINEIPDAELKDGVVQGILGTSLYFFEVKNGQVDPAFYLEAVNSLHRQLAGRFVYAALAGNNSLIRRLTTDASKIKFEGREQVGEVATLGEMAAMIPVTRVSQASEDAKSRSVTYRLPLGKKGMELKMVKEGNTWKVDTSDGLTVPLDFFFRKRGSRPTQYQR